MTRDDLLASLEGRPGVSVLILGGGINGVGLYRELALQGVDVYLADKGDFVSGASAASSHMIHGGLRYLQNSEFRLVRESVEERNRLLRNAPHGVVPLPTTIPIFHWTAGLVASALRFLRIADPSANRGALLVKVGLTLYDLYTRRFESAHGQRPVPPHAFASRRRALDRRPTLHPDIVCTATYHDACMHHPERLGLEVLLDAEAANSECRAINYLQATAARGDAVTLRDVLTGREFTVHPKVVVNATGAWVDFTNGALAGPTDFIGGTKGSHLVLHHPELEAALDGEMIYFENSDGRICILFPYQGKVMAGTTDLPVEDPEQAVCDAAEEAYILDSIRHVFPTIDLGERHIVFRFCGVRPLPTSDASKPGKVSRDHSCHRVPNTDSLDFPVYALVGGKWTTFRAFAAMVADRILPILGVARQASSADLPIGGGADYPAAAERDAWIQRLAEGTGLPHRRIEALFERYGTRARQLAMELQALGDDPLETLPDHSRQEIEWLVTHERVVRLEDLILRRTLLAMTGRLTRPMLHELAEILAPCLHWSADEQREAVEQALESLRLRHGLSLP